MTVHYDLQKLTDTLQDFYNATGVKIALARPDLSYLCTVTPQRHNAYCNAIQSTPVGWQACHCSDMGLLETCRASKKVETHVCHAGLVDVAVPILHEGEILGYMVLGQMKRDAVFSSVKERLAELTDDVKELKTHYEALPLFDQSRIESVLRIATMLAKYILLENMLKPNINRNAEKAVRFIHENLEQELTVESISRGIGLSKSTLYKQFHECFQCTVSEYINARRVDRSVELLISTDLSVEEIAQKVGFSSASYYSRTFKKQIGMAPLKFRKQQGSAQS